MPESLPEVSFYVLAVESSQERNLFACKLIEKAYRSGTFPYVLTDTDDHSRQLDDLLWTFRAGSFIPHQLYHDTSPELGNTVLIGNRQAPENWRKTLVNLSSQCPQSFQTYERILEILDNSEQSKSLGRNRYRHYQQAGLTITTHTR